MISNPYQFIIGLVIAGQGLNTLRRMVILRRQILDSASWPSVQGTVLRTGVKSRWSRLNSSFHRMHEPAVEYEYSVESVRYVGGRVAFPEVRTSLRGRAERTAARFPVGTPVVVTYNPASPGEAFLERESGSPFIPLFDVVGWAELILGLGMAVWAV